MKIHLIVGIDECEGEPTRYFIDDAYDAVQLEECDGDAARRESLLRSRYSAELIVTIPDDALASAFPAAPLVKGEVADPSQHGDNCPVWARMGGHCDCHRAEVAR